jgi:hypothetical protein
MNFKDVESGPKDIVITDENGEVKNYEIEDFQVNWKKNKIEQKPDWLQTQVSFSIDVDRSSALKMAMALDPIFEQYILKGYNVARGEAE